MTSPLALGHEIRVRSSALPIKACSIKPCGWPAVFMAVYDYGSRRTRLPMCRRCAARFAERHRLDLPPIKP